MKLVTAENMHELSRTGARLIAERLRDLARSRANVVLGLVGGRSVTGIYERLSAMDLKAWQTTHFFLADERRVPLEHPESNYRRVRKTLLDPLLARKQIREDNIHAMDMSLPPRKTAQTYSRELEALGGSFDLALLSAGEDGHVAGIFPEKSYPAKAAFTFFEDSPKAPKRRFTASPRLLSGTRFAIVLFAGDAKRAALRHFLDSTAETDNAEKVLKKIANLTVLTDQKG